VKVYPFHLAIPNWITHLDISPDAISFIFFFQSFGWVEIWILFRVIKECSFVFVFKRICQPPPKTKKKTNFYFCFLFFRSAGFYTPTISSISHGVCGRWLYFKRAQWFLIRAPVKVTNGISHRFAIQNLPKLLFHFLFFFPFLLSRRHNRLV
jgi:hypothetical protein